MTKYPYQYDPYCPICEWSCANKFAGGVHGPCQGCGRTDDTWNTMLGKDDTPAENPANSNQPNDDLLNWYTWLVVATNHPMLDVPRADISSMISIHKIVIDEEDDMPLIIGRSKTREISAWFSVADLNRNSDDYQALKNLNPGLVFTLVAYFRAKNKDLKEYDKRLWQNPPAPSNPPAPQASQILLTDPDTWVSLNPAQLKIRRKSLPSQIAEVNEVIKNSNAVHGVLLVYTTCTGSRCFTSFNMHRDFNHHFSHIRPTLENASSPSGCEAWQGICKYYEQIFGQPMP